MKEATLAKIAALWNAREAPNAIAQKLGLDLGQVRSVLQGLDLARSTLPTTGPVAIRKKTTARQRARKVARMPLALDSAP